MSSNNNQAVQVNVPSFGRVVHVYCKDGIIEIVGLHNVRVDEVVVFVGSGVRGVIINVEQDLVRAVVPDNSVKISQDDLVVAAVWFMTQTYSVNGSIITSVPHQEIAQNNERVVKKSADRGNHNPALKVEVPSPGIKSGAMIIKQPKLVVQWAAICGVSRRFMRKHWFACALLPVRFLLAELLELLAF